MTGYVIRRVGDGATLEDAHAVRRAVFVREQDVPEAAEMDGLDGEAIHVVGYSDTEGTPVGTARVRMPAAGVAKPERVAVRRAHRGSGLGRRLMERIESIARAEGCSRAELHAQTTVTDFYRALGYETCSDHFEEAGIPHVEMQKALD